MLTVSEVANRGKLAIRGLPLVFLLGFFFLYLSVISIAAADDSPSTESLADRLGDCNWQVNYRGRQYDLAPLTREALSRPIENDIRFAIQRVPEANARLETMTSKQRNARTYTIIASIFLTTLIATKILESREKNPNDKRPYRIAEYGQAGLFLAATVLSWSNMREAKKELVRAVEDFNTHSPHKIEPVNGAMGAE